MAIGKKRISREGYNKLEKDLEYLVSVKRSEVAEKLKEARSFGDLSENAEYDEAKNEQGILEARIAELEAYLANAEIIDDDAVSIDEVGVGSVIKLKDLEFNEIEIVITSYSIHYTKLYDFNNFAVSVSSLAFLNCNYAISSNFFHCISDKLSNCFVARRNCGNSFNIS